MTVELNIKEVRKKQNITLEELEFETGIDRKRLSDLEDKKVKVEDVLFIEMLLIAEAFREK